MATNFKDTEGEQGFVTLANGDTVASDSLAWRDECATRWRHVLTLRSIGSVVERRAYVATVADREGNESGKRLTEAYAADFEKRKAAEAQARREIAP